MPLPVGARREVERALRDAGLGSRIVTSVPVGGGCINHGARVESDTGSRVFLKWNPAAPAGMFPAEADGLIALRAAHAPVLVPEPIAWGGGEGGPAWLLLEYVEPGPARPDTDERAGRGLAAIHAAGGQGDFGWDHDNWIGSLEQPNAWTTSWGEFWRDQRIGPQLRRARERGRLPDDVFDRVVERTSAALDGVTAPELLHGDLWAGNAFTAKDGTPVMIDPATYRGDGEVDLAMTELFGGFGPRFYAAYRDARATTTAYGSYKRDLYQLYYLLVHVNLFGGSYVAAARDAAARIVGALG